MILFPINIEIFEIHLCKILSLFFVLEKLRSVTFWPKCRFKYLTLCIILSFVSLITMRVSDLWGLKIAKKCKKKIFQICKSLLLNLFPFHLSLSSSNLNIFFSFLNVLFNCNGQHHLIDSVIFLFFFCEFSFFPKTKNLKPSLPNLTLWISFSMFYHNQMSSTNSIT